jgi:hypothetical protein
MSCLEDDLNEDGTNFLGFLWVQGLSTLDLLSILEDNDSWELLELEVFLGRWEFFNVDLEGNGIVSVALGSPGYLVSVLFLDD